MIIYQERQYIYFSVTLIFFVIFIVLAWWLLTTTHQPISQIIWWVVAILDLLYALNFIYLRIVLTEKYLKFGFGLFVKKLPLQSIFFWQAKTLEFKKFNGMGIRRAKDGTIGYLAKDHQGLEIKSTLGHFFITTDQGENWIQKIKAAKL